MKDIKILKLAISLCPELNGVTIIVKTANGLFNYIMWHDHHNVDTFMVIISRICRIINFDRSSMFIAHKKWGV